MSEQVAVELPMEGGGEEAAIDMFVAHNEDVQNVENVDEPSKKKLKTETSVQEIRKLESRLEVLLRCTVCLELPKCAIYQCTNGHLMCSCCFTHLLADARLRDEPAGCPNCRTEIKHSATRNLAVENAVKELPSPCSFCDEELPRNLLEQHELNLCPNRVVECEYERIGCPWKGPFHELEAHRGACAHPNKTGKEVMEVLLSTDVTFEREKKLYSQIFTLLSLEKVQLIDIQLRPYRTDDFVNKLFYESSRFSAFNNQWVVKAHIKGTTDGEIYGDRQMVYQLILKTKTSVALQVSFVALKDPVSDIKLSPKIYSHTFSDANSESSSFLLPLVDLNEVNKVMAAKIIQFRLIAFSHSTA